MADNPNAPHIWLSLRIALTATLCLIFGEWLHLGQTALSVYSAHLAMVLYPYSAFQKSVERVTGRLLGVAYGLLIVIFFGDLPVLLLLLMLLGQFAFFYVNASGKLAYATLMGGLFLGLIVAMAITTPLAAQAYAVELVEQLVLAAIMINLVNWVTGGERTLEITTGGQPLWPLRPEWISKALMVSTTQVCAMLVCFWFDLPTLPTMVSSTVLAISTADPIAMNKKAYLRVVGAVLGSVYALIGLVLIAYMPYFSLLVAIVFYGMFISALGTKIFVDYSYAFLQMGLALPMVLIGSSGEMGTINTGLLRLVGVVAGLLVAEAIFVFWPWPITAALAVAAAPADNLLSAEVVHPAS